MIFDQNLNRDLRNKLPDVITKVSKVNFVQRLKTTNLERVSFALVENESDIRMSLAHYANFMSVTNLDLLVERIQNSIYLDTSRSREINDFVLTIKSKCDSVIKKLKGYYQFKPSIMKQIEDRYGKTVHANEPFTHLCLSILVNGLVSEAKPFSKKLETFDHFSFISSYDIEIQMLSEFDIQTPANVGDSSLNVLTDNITVLDLINNIPNSPEFDSVRHLGVLAMSRFQSLMEQYVIAESTSRLLADLSILITEIHLMVNNSDELISETKKLVMNSLLSQDLGTIAPMTSDSVDPGSEPSLSGLMIDKPLVGRFLFISVVFNPRRKSIEDVTCTTHPTSTTVAIFNARSLFGGYFQINVDDLNENGIGRLLLGLLGSIPDILVSNDSRVFVQSSQLRNFISMIWNPCRITDTVLTSGSRTTTKQLVGAGEFMTVDALAINEDIVQLRTMSPRFSLRPGRIRFSLPLNLISDSMNSQADLIKINKDIAVNLQSKLDLFSTRDHSIKVHHNQIYPTSFELEWTGKGDN